jgi:hypothetical protein
MNLGFLTFVAQVVRPVGIQSIISIDSIEFCGESGIVSHLHTQLFIISLAHMP